jgi:hypothetical protein
MNSALMPPSRNLQSGTTTKMKSLHRLGSN